MTAHYVYAKRHQLRKLRGQTAYVDAARARTHIDTLLGAGWSVRSIGAASGVPASTVSRLRLGKQQTARPETILAVLRVRTDTQATETNHDGEPFVSRVGTVRRIQALLYMGWRHEDLSARTGLRTACLLSQQGRWVTRTTHDVMASLYRELSHVPGPSEATRGRARRLGYVGPAAWDDIDHDLEPELGEWVLRRSTKDAGEWVPAEEAPWAADDSRRIGAVQ